MKAVLLSIRPEWCKKILSGEKTVELRMTCPVHGTPFKVYIYCTRKASKEFILDDDNWDVSAKKHGGWPGKRGRVIGEFTCKKITFLTHVGKTGSWELESLYVMAPGSYYKPADELLEMACMSKETAEKYLKGHNGCGWHISDLKIYDRPRKLTDFLPNCRFCEEGECEYRRVYCEHQNYDCNPDGSVNVVLCNKRVRKAPQIWCYVEELKDV